MNKEAQQPQSIKKTMLIAGLVLASFALFASILVALTYTNTVDRIAQNQRDFILKSLNEVFPSTQYDNDLVADSFLVNNTLLSHEESLIYPAFKNKQPSGAILTVIAPNGYNGQIKLLVGITLEGEIHAVRVVEHKETPGLGDPIEIKRSDWITQFSNRSHSDPEPERWRVKKDGGEFDQLTGATITPRAIVKAVSNALLYYQQYSDEIYSKNSKNTSMP